MHIRMFISAQMDESPPHMTHKTIWLVFIYSVYLQQASYSSKVSFCFLTVLCGINMKMGGGGLSFSVSRVTTIKFLRSCVKFCWEPTRRLVLQFPLYSANRLNEFFLSPHRGLKGHKKLHNLQEGQQMFYWITTWLLLVSNFIDWNLLNLLTETHKCQMEVELC